MANKQKLLGLIGFPLSHSFSQNYFRNKFNSDNNLQNFDYLNFPIKTINELPVVIEQNPELLGFNVTIPYKEQIIKYLDEIEPEAQKAGAVNTVKVIRNISDKYFLKGYNTDIYGFKQSLLPFLSRHHQKALILGTGGAAKAVAYVLKRLNLDFYFVSRNNKAGNILSYQQLTKDIIREHRLIINTTPLGMYPNIDTVPDIPYEWIDEKFLLYDLVYNPEETKFLKSGKEKGAKIINGYQMLVLQAEKAWEIFTS